MDRNSPMFALMQGVGRAPWKAMALAWGIGIVSGSMAAAQQVAVASPGPQQQTACSCGIAGPHHHNTSGGGTLGYGPPGIFPGFQGFGLGYHPGYGYGGAGLGPGAFGGYPFYGGPGYPHPWPELNRFGHLVPFPYYGGPGGPDAVHPNYFGGVGPLAVDPPVVEIGQEPGEADWNSGFGAFTGVVPYPESVLAPFTTVAALRGTGSGVSTPAPAAPNTPSPMAPSPATPSPTPPSTTTPASGPSLGLESEPVNAGGVRGMKVTAVVPKSLAEKAGLNPGDVILSVNDYVTVQPGNLEWIIINASPNRVLRMHVRTLTDAKEKTFLLPLP